MKKAFKIQLNLKEPWQTAKGHTPHMPGAGEHADKREKRLRTRSAKKRNMLKDQEE
jgi:hypothetical protein